MRARGNFVKRYENEIRLIENMVVTYPEVKEQLVKDFIMDDGVKAMVVTGLPRSTSIGSLMDRQLDRYSDAFERYELLKRWVKFLDVELALLSDNDAIFVEIVRQEMKNADARRKQEQGRPNWRRMTAFRYAEAVGQKKPPAPFTVSKWWNDIIMAIMLRAVAKGLIKID